MSDASLRHKNEKAQKDILEQLFENTGMTQFEMFRNFPVFTPRFNLARFLVHYELFKQICDLPGVIIELGVYQGASLFTWAKLAEIFCPTDIRKTVFGFDTFEGFPSLSEADGAEDKELDRQKGGFAGGGSIEADLGLAQQAMNADKHLKHINRIELVKGDMCATIPEFVRARGDGLKVALLNIDCDLYEPTKTALENFVPRMVKGGIIVLDEYALETFGGESKAVDEYFQKHLNARPDIKKFPWHSVPSGYIKVDW